MSECSRHGVNVIGCAHLGRREVFAVSDPTISDWPLFTMRSADTRGSITMRVPSFEQAMLDHGDRWLRGTWGTASNGGEE
jgi:hypothetical protein